MKDIKQEEKADNIRVIDYIMRTKLPNICYGLSQGDYGCIAHLMDDATEQEQNDALAIMQNENILTINATKTVIIVGIVDDSVITCPELGNNFDYAIFQFENIDGETIYHLQSDNNVTDGSLELTAQQAGRYLIVIIEQNGTRSGYIEIEVMGI